MPIIFQNLFLFLLALTLAIVEIQIEGPHGWASKLPAWRPHPSRRLARVFSACVAGKPCTGYHLAIFFLVLLIFHLPFAFGMPFTLAVWIKTLSLYFLFLVLWDFLWFVLNPHYPLKEFNKARIWWHKKWIFGVPIDYFGGALLSLAVLLPYSVAHQTADLLMWWLANLGLFALETLIAIVITLFWLKIDTWRPAH